MRFDKVSYDLNLADDERCVYHCALQHTSRPVCFGVSDQALFIARERFFKLEAYSMERIPISDVKEVVLGRERGPWTWIKWTIVLAFGIASSTAMAIGLILAPNAKPGVVGVGGPIAFIVVGLSMLIDSRWRLVLTIRTKTKDLKWRPSIFDKRDEVCALREGFLDACRYMRVSTRRLDLTNQSEIKKFWKWFENHVKNGRINRDAVKTRLHNLCDRLDVGVSELSYDGEREMIITANYAQDAFPIVEELVAAAPQIAGLAVKAFKPSLKAKSTYIFDDTEYSLDKIFFAPYTDGFELVIVVYAYLKMMDLEVIWALYRDLLGEYEFVFGVQYAEIIDLSEATEDLFLRHISELSDYVEDFHRLDID